MSEFTSKIISWKNFENEHIKWSNNSAFQDIIAFIIGYAREKKNLKVLI